MEKDLEDQLNAFKALANEKRLAILLEVSRRERGLPFERLSQKLSLNPNTLDYHLEKMTNVGLIVNIPRTPVTKRVLHKTHFKTLGAIRRPGEESVEETRCYSYYQITEFGKEILKKLGVSIKKPEKSHEK